MAFGTEVYKGAADMRMAEAMLNVRQAFDKIHNVRGFLENHPVVEGVDPLTTEPFNYTADEAAFIRTTFEAFDDLAADNAELFALTRRFTGLD